VLTDWDDCVLFRLRSSVGTCLRRPQDNAPQHHNQRGAISGAIITPRTTPRAPLPEHLSYSTSFITNSRHNRADCASARRWGEMAANPPPDTLWEVWDSGSSGCCSKRPPLPVIFTRCRHRRDERTMARGRKHHQS
jgi:hypothetical protein